ncbi:response regulator transcription factor [Paenibacillus sedimenti]|uniref:Response regulator n=1 Tax=Paenibacillus sedimenti TaxID=2770274 RepID=A0A926QI81_9BACL|nr:response regulator [Paenibacillus sedimenti]MBD0380230.1 response regulator [Paenibacillus sedimenti]
MYRVMLVDDEVGVRNSIKAKIDWEQAGYVIESEASNGNEALQLLDDGSLPDLVITDIRMPQMDGIAFIQACKEQYPQLKMIVLSGYSDFEYMKSAIQLGVKDYLLKPVVRSELIALLAKLAAELEADKHLAHKQELEVIKNNELLQVMQEHLIWQLVKNEWFSVPAVKERMQQLQLSALAQDDLHAQFVTVEMRIPQGRLEDWSERKDLLYLAFQMLCRETAQKWQQVFPFYEISHPSMMHFLIVIEDAKGHERFIETFVRDLKRYIKSYLKVDSVFGIGEPINGLRLLKNGYASSMLAWSQGTVHNDHFQPNTRVLELTHAFSPEAEKKLMQTIENLDMKSFTKKLQEIFSSEMDTPMFVFTFLSLRIILMFNAIAKKFQFGDTSLQTYLWNCQMTVRDYQSREQVLEQLYEMAELVMNEVKRTRFSSGQHMVEAIVKYIDENFSYELTLSSLADMFHLNETYLSGLFKQSTGVTFSDYVTKLRLTKAAALLEENVLKLTDIATLVGYSSSSYFSTAFKKSYGKSPKEYREQFLLSQ